MLHYRTIKFGTLGNVSNNVDGLWIHPCGRTLHNRQFACGRYMHFSMHLDEKKTKRIIFTFIIVTVAAP